jgi:hypothetical protein
MQHCSRILLPLMNLLRSNMKLLRLEIEDRTRRQTQQLGTLDRRTLQWASRLKLVQ